MRINANAKINLGLDVLGRLPNGYHEVSMIMQEVSLCDYVDIEKSKNSVIDVSLKNSDLPTDENNIVYRAAKLFFDYTMIDGGCKIILEKHIPVCAGLGGGSADGAAVLKGLNELYGSKLSLDELVVLGLKLGADVPFCILGKTAHAGGIGEKLSPLKSKLKFNVCIIKPDIDISTPLAYRAIDSVSFPHPDTKKCIEALESGNSDDFFKNTANAFEYVCRPIHKEIDLIKDHFMSNGALFSMMSGSGPSVFGLFKTKADAIKAFDSYNGSFGGGGVCEFI